MKMGSFFWYVGLVLYFNEISSTLGQQTENDGGAINRRPIVDPIANLFSEVGNLFLDIDETYSKQTAPKVDYEGRIEERILGDRRTPLREYFARIQRNYRNLQNRIGPAISKGVSDILTGRSTYRVDIKERDGNTFIDASLPLIPLRLFQTQNTDKAIEASRDGEEHISSRQLDLGEPSTVQEKLPSEVSRNPFAQYDHEKTTKPTDTETMTEQENKSLDISRNPFAKYDHEKITKPKITDNQSPDGIISEVVKRTDSLLQNAQHTNNLLLSLGRKTIDDTAALIRRSGETSKPPESDPKYSGRILGDVLYSESTYDDYIRQILKDHGKWLLDNPLLVPKPISNEASKDSLVTEGSVISEKGSLKTPVEEIPTETSNLVAADSQRNELHEVHSDKIPEDSVSAYYDLTKANGERKETLNLFAHSEKSAETGKRGEEPKESVILAFTPDGVPLKLRMGPEIENPVKYLHKTLRAAGVSINIPVQSYEDIEPTGGEILQLGSASGGILTRAQQFDLSSSYDLKSLLRSLKKSKTPKKF